MTESSLPTSPLPAIPAFASVANQNYPAIS
jgi:hypothetical protein